MAQQKTPEQIQQAIRAELESTASSIGITPRDQEEVIEQEPEHVEESIEEEEIPEEVPEVAATEETETPEVQSTETDETPAFDDEPAQTQIGVKWDEVSKELGIEATSKEDIAKKIRESDDKVKDIEAQLASVKVFSEASAKVSELDKLLTLPMDELVRTDMKINGMLDDEIEDLMADMNESDIKKHYYQAKSNIRNAKAQITQNAENSVKAQQEKVAQERVAFDNQVKEAIMQTKTLFGARLDKDEAKADEKRSNAAKAYDSGSFEKALKDPAQRAKLFSLWHFGDSVEKLVSQKATSQATRQIQKEFGNPTKFPTNGAGTSQKSNEKVDSAKTFRDALKADLEQMKKG